MAIVLHTPVHYAHIDGEPSGAQLVVDDVLHDVRLFYLPKPQPRIPEPHVLEVVLLGRANVPAPLHVVAGRFAHEERLPEVPDIALDGIGVEPRMQFASERCLDLRGVRERSDG